MKQEDKLKNTLREYYDNQEVPYDAHEWERVSAQLGDQRKNKRRKKLAFILIFLLGVSIGLFQFLKLFTPAKQLAASAMAFNSSEHQTPPAGLPDLKNKESKKENIIKTTQPYKEEIKNLPLTIGTEKFKSPEKVETSVAETLENPQVKKSPVTKNEATKQLIYGEKSPDKNKESEYGGPSKIMSARANSTPPVSVSGGLSGVQNVKSESDYEEVIPKSGNDILANTKNGNDKEQNKTYAENRKEKLQNETASSSFIEDKKPAAEEKSKIILADEEKIPATTSSVSSIMFVSSDTTSVVNFVDTIIPSYAPLSGEGLFYELGAVGYYGWKGPEKRDARGLSPLLGINYMSRLSKKSSFSFGVQYLQVGNLSNSSKTSRVSTYKYGEQIEVTVVTPTITLSRLYASIILRIRKMLLEVESILPIS